MFLVSFVISIPSQALTISSLNIEWFGKGGQVLGKIEDEYRLNHLNEFLKAPGITSDIYVFQEIAEPNLLKKIVPDKKCVTYYQEQKEHQHIVICVPENMYLNHYSIEEVRLENPGLRPALVVQINYQNEIIDIVGLHLKAGQKNTETRVKQIHELLQNSSLSYKAILMGDFNTYKKEDTDQIADDNLILSTILSTKNFFEVKNTTKTFINFNDQIFDRTWPRNINVKKHQILGPCQEGSTELPYSDYSFYERFISDHCLQKLEI